MPHAAFVGGEADRQGALVLACEFAARHPGNFLPSQFAVARAARQRLGLSTVFVLPERARRRYWVPQIADAGFQCEFLPHSAWRRPAALLRIARDARARIIHSHFVWFDLESLYAGHRTAAAVIWHVHNGLCGYPMKQRLSDLVKARLLARGCVAVVAVSEQVGRDLLRRGFPANRTTVIQNAIVLDRLGSPLVARQETRSRLGIDEETFVVLSFCWPPVRKGADVLVEAMSRIHDGGLGRPSTAILVGERVPVEGFLREKSARCRSGSPSYHPWTMSLHCSERRTCS